MRAVVVAASARAPRGEVQWVKKLRGWILGQTRTGDFACYGGNEPSFLRHPRPFCFNRLLPLFLSAVIRARETNLFQINFLTY